jgi:hypothetical protein
MRWSARERRRVAELGDDAARDSIHGSADGGRGARPDLEVRALDRVDHEPAGQPPEGAGQFDGVADPEGVGRGGSELERQRPGGGVEPDHAARLRAGGDGVHDGNVVGLPPRLQQA